MDLVSAIHTILLEGRVECLLRTWALVSAHANMVHNDLLRAQEFLVASNYPFQARMGIMCVAGISRLPSQWMQWTIVSNFWFSMPR